MRRPAALSLSKQGVRCQGKGLKMLAGARPRGTVGRAREYGTPQGVGDGPLRGSQQGAA